MAGDLIGSTVPFPSYSFVSHTSGISPNLSLSPLFPSPHLSTLPNYLNPTMSDLHDSITPSSTTPLPVHAHSSRPLPIREDCWSEEATSTLVDAWGRRYVELNRGNLRQKDWQDVADAVNTLHGHTKKTYRTDVQCKNRIDTIKKKYKTEKARISSSDGAVSSSWPFFERLDALIGSYYSVKKPSPTLSSSPPVAVPLPYRNKLPPTATAVVLPQKRSMVTAAAMATGMDDAYSRRSYSGMAGVHDNDDDDEEEDYGEEREDEEEEERRSGVEEGEREREGMRRLAKAIESFGEMYKRVEGEKLRQMVDLEKQRMQFSKDLEIQRMQMFMDTQVQLERIKRGRRSGSNDIYS